MAPHFGHFTLVSFDTPAHPREKNARITNARMMFTQFAYLIIIAMPSFHVDTLSYKNNNANYHFCPK